MLPVAQFKVDQEILVDLIGVDVHLVHFVISDNRPILRVTVTF